MALSVKTKEVLVDALADRKTADAIDAALDARAVVAGKASATATLPGMTTPVKLQAVTAGSAGNSIVITANGTDSISALVTAWNSAHPSNTVAVASGNASQIPTSGSFSLSGGSDAAAPVEFSEDQARRIVAMCADQKAGDELIAAIHSGAILSDSACRRIVQGMSGDGAGAAGNDFINAVQASPRAKKFML